MHTSENGRWQIADGTDVVPADLVMGPPRYRCTIDGTRVYSALDADLHDEAFHPPVVSSDARVDDTRYRSEALDQAARTATGHETAGGLVDRARAFAGFLRGDPDPYEGTAPATSVDADVATARAFAGRDFVGQAPANTPHDVGDTAAAVIAQAYADGYEPAAMSFRRIPGSDIVGIVLRGTAAR